MYEEKAIENGMLTGERLKEMFQSLHGKIVQAIDSKIVLLGTALPQNPQDGDRAKSDNIFVESLTEEICETAARNVTHILYTYEGRCGKFLQTSRFLRMLSCLRGGNFGWQGNQYIK